MQIETATQVVAVLDGAKRRMLIPPAIRAAITTAVSRRTPACPTRNASGRVTRRAPVVDPAQSRALPADPPTRGRQPIRRSVELSPSNRSAAAERLLRTSRRTKSRRRSRPRPANSRTRRSVHGRSRFEEPEEAPVGVPACTAAVWGEDLDDRPVVRMGSCDDATCRQDVVDRSLRDLVDVRGVARQRGERRGAGPLATCMLRQCMARRGVLALARAGGTRCQVVGRMRAEQTCRVCGAA